MPVDPTPEQLSKLNPQIRDKALILINALRGVGVPAVIQPLGGYRTQQQQLELYSSGKGVTSTLKSRHILGMAFDLDIYGMPRSRIPSWFWDLIGPWAENQLGLTWGGRWKNPYDPGHFQL